MFNLGDQIFKSDGVGNLPQSAKELSLQIFVTPFFKTENPTASVSFASSIINESNTQKFYIRKLILYASATSTGGGYKALNNVTLKFSSVDQLMIPQPSGLTTNVQRNYRVTGDPASKTIELEFPDGFLMQPNQNINVETTYNNTSAFLITDSVTSYVLMHWTL
jgi:hypothetical protein